MKSLAQLRSIARRLNYGIKTKKKSSIDNRIYRYRVAPINGGGSTQYFESRDQIENWLNRVIQIRKWQEEK